MTTIYQCAVMTPSRAAFESKQGGTHSLAAAHNVVMSRLPTQCAFHYQKWAKNKLSQGLMYTDQVVIPVQSSCHLSIGRLPKLETSSSWRIGVKLGVRKGGIARQSKLLSAVRLLLICIGQQHLARR